MSAAEHAAAVREKIRLLHSDAHYEEADEALLALVALAERATELETALRDERTRVAIAEEAAENNRKRATELERKRELAEEDDGIVERHNRERAERAEKRLTEQESWARSVIDAANTEADTQRERAERAERELAELNRALEIPRQYDVLLGEWKDRAERAETALSDASAFVDMAAEARYRAETALREIAALVSDNGRYEVVWDADAGEWVPQFKAIARAALGETA